MRSIELTPTVVGLLFQVTSHRRMPRQSRRSEAGAWSTTLGTLVFLRLFITRVNRQV